jgi:hypothetical protein
LPRDTIDRRTIPGDPTIRRTTERFRPIPASPRVTLAEHDMPSTRRLGQDPARRGPGHPRPARPAGPDSSISNHSSDLISPYLQEGLIHATAS